MVVACVKICLCMIAFACACLCMCVCMIEKRCVCLRSFGVCMFVSV